MHGLSLVHSALAEGAYAWVSRLTDKMRRELVLLAAAGVTIVGISTVLEVMVARDEGVTVLVLSLVTNMIVRVFLGMGKIEKATTESMDKGSSAEIVLLLRASAGMGNDDK
jgi:purine nucleoside phosphorylase